ncbi:uncharacterized protein TNCV_1445561 [Trichonephila clavipes]|nr:uncharacterized protein TNCV_1445561 [Trichonephila clavipes]
MMNPAYNKKKCAAFFSRQESITGERPTSFPKKIQPCLTRDSNPNPLGYKRRVIATILAGRLTYRWGIIVLRTRSTDELLTSMREPQVMMPRCHMLHHSTQRRDQIIIKQTETRLI